MIWLVVITITIAFAASMIVLARDVLRHEHEQSGECHCTRYRLCHVCLSALREERDAA